MERNHYFNSQNSNAEHYYPSRSFALISRYKVDHWWFNSRYKILSWIFARYLANIQPACFLEVGCGQGDVIGQLSLCYPNWQMIGTDIHEEAILTATHSHTKAQYLCDDFLVSPKIKDRIYGAIGAFDVLEHIDDDMYFLHTFFALLAPKGRLLITVPQHKWLWSEVDSFSQHKRRYSNKELSFKALKAGFRIIDSGSFVSIPLPLMALSRLSINANRVYCPEQELKVSPFLNKFLMLVMTLEIVLIKLGLRFPFGGSRYIVLEKI